MNKITFHRKKQRHSAILSDPSHPQSVTEKLSLSKNHKRLNSLSKCQKLLSVLSSALCILYFPDHCQSYTDFRSKVRHTLAFTFRFKNNNRCYIMKEKKQIRIWHRTNQIRSGIENCFSIMDVATLVNLQTENTKEFSSRYNNSSKERQKLCQY